METNFVGIVLGGDMNSYAVARAFYEEYNIKTIVLGQKPIFPTAPSKIIEGFYYPGLLKDDVLIEALTDINEKYPDKKKILFGNIDYYVKHIIHNRNRIMEISDSFIIPMVSEKKFDELFNKSSFYALCEKHGLDYPKCKVFDIQNDDIDNFEIPFEYPIFVKASDSVRYSKFNFEGKQKGYKIENITHLKEVISKVKVSGYDGNFIFQEYIEGDDDSMFVYTAYVNKNHKVVAMTGGKILMHDRTPELIGNYNAISNACDRELCEKLKNFLEAIEFTGICHFDIQYDAKRKGYVVFEINIRQGRSNLYTCASGVNLAKLIVDDYIYDKDDEFFIADKEFAVSVVPKNMLNYAMRKTGSKEITTDNFYRFGMAPYDKGFKRSIHQLIWSLNTMRKFNKYNI